MSAPRPIPEALLERYLANALGADEKKALEERLAASESDRARLDALRADAAAFLIKHPAGPVAAKLAAPSRRRSWALLLAPVGLALSAFVAVVLLKPPPEPDVGLKGDLALAVYRQTAAGSERLESGAEVKPGDKLRFEVRAQDPGHVAILSRDGAGHVTVYYPYAATRSAPYRPEEPLLPGAIALDDTLGAEDVWALYGREPFELAPAIQRLEQGSAPDGVSARMRWTKK